MDAILKQELTELQKQAWDQLQVTASYGGHTHTLNVVALKLAKCIVEAEARTALNQPKQEPVGYGVFWKEKGQHFSVSLDDAILFSGEFSNSLKFARAIEAALKNEKPSYEAIVPALRTDDHMPTLEEFKAEFLSPPGFEDYSVVESKGFLVWMKREDVGQNDLICFYDGDKRAVLTPIQHKAVLEVEARAAHTRDELVNALKGLTDIIEKGGLLNLSNGVQLGQMSWYDKANNAMNYARTVLAKASEA